MLRLAQTSGTVGCLGCSFRPGPIYVLFVFSYIAMVQCLIWGTFSGVKPNLILGYYQHFEPNLTNGTSSPASVGRFIDLLGLWGPIVFIPVVPLTSWILTRKSGLRLTILWGAALTGGGALLRAVPCLVPVGTGSPQLLWLIHIAQMLNAAAGPFVMATPSRLSALWFPPSRRTTATAIAQTSNGLGGAVSFLLCSQLVSSSSDIPLMIYVIAGIALVPIAIMALFGMPPDEAAPYHRSNRGAREGAAGIQGIQGAAEAAAVPALAPERQPSPSPASQQQQRQQAPPADNQLAAPTARDFLRSVGVIAAHPSLLAIVVADGLSGGVQSAWSTVLQQSLAQVGFTNDQVGWLGFTQVFMGCFGGLCSGAIADRFLRRRLKWLLVASYACSFFFFAWLTMQFSAAGHPAVLPGTFATAFTAVCLSGIFQGACDPLSYELAAELTYPVPEGTSAGVLTLIYNAACLVVLLILGYDAHVNVAQWANLLMAATMLLCALLTSAVRERYRRSDAEDLAASKLLNNSKEEAGSGGGGSSSSSSSSTGGLSQPLLDVAD